MIARLFIEAEGSAQKVTIAQALEFRREAYDLGRTQFTRIIGLTKSHYSEILSGKRRLPLRATKRAFAIGVPATVLLQPDCVVNCAVKPSKGAKINQNAKPLSIRKTKKT